MMVLHQTKKRYIVDELKWRNCSENGKYIIYVTSNYLKFIHYVLLISYLNQNLLNVVQSRLY